MMAILKRLYKELMIVGVVAVGIMTASMSMDIDSHSKHTFEIIHVMVFGVMVLYLASVLIVMAFNERTSEAWRHWENELTDHTYREMAAEVREHEHRRTGKGAAAVGMQKRRKSSANQHQHHNIKLHSKQQVQNPSRKSLCGSR